MFLAVVFDGFNFYFHRKEATDDYYNALMTKIMMTFTMVTMTMVTIVITMMSTKMLTNEREVPLMLESKARTGRSVSWKDSTLPVIIVLSICLFHFLS